MTPGQSTRGASRDQRGLRALVAAFAALVIWLGAPAAASAHSLTPPSLVVHERAPARYDVTFRRPRLAAAALTLDWPWKCTASAPATAVEGDLVVDRFELVCAAPLEGRTLRVFGLAPLELSLLVSVEQDGAEPVRALLAPDRGSVLVPRRRSGLALFVDYTELGVRHLLGGPDHLLFVLGLVLLVNGFRRRLLALTAFTLGHGLTLCLATLSIVSAPAPPVELGIAATLVYLALELLAPRSPGATDAGMSVLASGGARRAFLVAVGFGLVHGLGFARALAETGLPPHAIPLSLGGFNLGIELGQLLVVAALVPCLGLSARLGPARSAKLRVLSAHAIGAIAAMWCLERAGALFGLG